MKKMKFLRIPKFRDELFIDYSQKQIIDLGKTQDNIATKDDIKMLIEMMDKRFEAVDKRFEDMYKYMNKGFEAVDKRFEDMFKYMDKRFDAIDKRFSSLQWFMGIAFAIISILMVMLKIFG